MINIRTEIPIDANFSVQYGDNSNFDGSEKNYLDVFIHISGSGSLLSYPIQRMYQSIILMM